MLRLSTLALLAVLSGAAAVSVDDGLSVELMAKFKSWSDYHGKSYESHDEKMKRLQIWLDNDGT